MIEIRISSLDAWRRLRLIIIIHKILNWGDYLHALSVSFSNSLKRMRICLYFSTLSTWYDVFLSQTQMFLSTSRNFLLRLVFLFSMNINILIFNYFNSLMIDAFSFISSPLCWCIQNMNFQKGAATWPT